MSPSNKDISIYVGITHLYGMVFESIYGIIIPKNNIFDSMYILFFLSVTFSWMLLKDECLISYLEKIKKNPNYIMGSEPGDVTDVIELFHNRITYEVFHHANYIIRVVSLVVVNNRTTHVSSYYFTPTLVLYLLYICDTTYRLNYRKKLYPYFQIIFCCYLYIVYYQLLNPMFSTKNQID